MTSLHELLARRAELEKQIADTSSEERLNAINKIKTLMVESGLSMADIGVRPQANKADRAVKPRGKVAPKYRNSVTGEYWTGRGLKPKWMQAAIAGGASMGDFKI